VPANVGEIAAAPTPAAPSRAPADTQATLNKLRQQIGNALKDPDKVKVTECIGVRGCQDPQPSGHPPSSEECDRILQQVSRPTPTSQSSDPPVPSAPSSATRESDNRTVAAVPRAGSDKSTREGCESNWTKCTDNADLVNHYSNWMSAQAACQIAATDEVKYGSPKWPWLSFSSFLTGNTYVTSGIATAIEPDAHCQNVFGAMVHARVFCTYDLRAQHVTGVSIVPR
jgi:hypothetical protein